VLTVGHHALRFVDSEVEEPEDEFQKTMVISTRDAAALMAGSPKAAAALQTPAANDYGSPASSAAAPSFPNGVLPRAKLQVLSGQFAGRELELVKTLTTLGRPGVQVAAITRRAAA
jgi:hypothetical protein